MKLEFSSIEEMKEFVAQLKGTRGKKGDDEAPAGASTGSAPQPLMPPGGAVGFTPPGGAPQQGGFPGGNPFGGDPAVSMLVTRINTALDSAIAKGQPADQALNWFRLRCGPEAATATMDQIKAVFLPRLTVPMLEETAKLMGA